MTNDVEKENEKKKRKTPEHGKGRDKWSFIFFIIHIIGSTYGGVLISLPIFRSIFQSPWLGLFVLWLFALDSWLLTHDVPGFATIMTRIGASNWLCALRRLATWRHMVSKSNTERWSTEYPFTCCTCTVAQHSTNSMNRQYPILILVWPCHTHTPTHSSVASWGCLIYSCQIDLTDTGLDLLNLATHTYLHMVIICRF